jgi:hypothetical protein
MMPEFIVAFTVIVGLIGTLGMCLCDTYTPDPIPSESMFIKLSEISKKLEQMKEKLEELEPVPDIESTTITGYADEYPKYHQFLTLDDFRAYCIEEDDGFIVILPKAMFRGKKIKEVHRVMTTRSTVNEPNIVIDYIDQDDKEMVLKYPFPNEKTSERFMNWIKTL